MPDRSGTGTQVGVDTRGRRYGQNLIGNRVSKAPRPPVPRNEFRFPLKVQLAAYMIP